MRSSTFKAKSILKPKIYESHQGGVLEQAAHFDFVKIGQYKQNRKQSDTPEMPFTARTPTFHFQDANKLEHGLFKKLFYRYSWETFRIQLEVHTFHF